MTTEGKVSPLPDWEIYAGENFTCICEVGTDMGNYLGNAVCEIKTWDGKRHNPSAHFVRERAERIVRAVNAHDRLVEALELILHSFDDGPPSLQSIRLDDACESARELLAALAAAKEGA